jgi:hypothetical protein
MCPTDWTVSWQGYGLRPVKTALAERASDARK